MQSSLFEKLESIVENTPQYIKCDNLIISESFIEKHKNVLGWKNISGNKNLSEEFIDRHSDLLDWYLISSNYLLSQKMIEKHSHKLNWNKISANPDLTESFIEQNLDKMIWENITLNSKISEQFVEKYIDKINWNKDHLLNLSEKFMDEHFNKLGPYTVSRSSLSEEFLRKYDGKLYTGMLYNICKLSDNFIEENFCKYYLMYHHLSFNPHISENLLNKYSDKLYWSYISLRDNLSNEFIQKNIQKIVWTKLSGNIEITDSFLEKFNTLISSRDISLNPSLRCYQVKKYPNLFYINYLLSNKNLPFSLKKLLAPELNINSINYNEHSRELFLSDTRLKMKILRAEF